ncbi:hypothetical protein [Catellatospora sp. NPDC049609]
MSQNPQDMFGEDDYPAYTMGRAAEMLGAVSAGHRADRTVTA